ncbi:MAG: 50S ribosomal protein L10 [archaeon]
MAHVAKYKKESVKEFTRLLDEYPIIGVVNMKNLPTKQLQKMRENLRGKVELRMTKKRLIKLAIENSTKPDIGKLKDHLKGMPALLFTKENPFSLFSTLKKNKSKAPIGAGQTAPNDIIVPAGKTSFSPGPVIGELGAYKIMTGIEDGKIAIKKDCVVAKEGDIVNAKLAGLLTRLGIEPMEIGLNLVAVYENKEIMTKDVLDIDEDAYRKNFETAAAMAFNLAINAGYPTTETIRLLIQIAASESRALTKEADILTDETVGTLLAKAESQADSLNSKLDIKKPEEKSSGVQSETELPVQEEAKIEEAPKEEDKPAEPTEKPVEEAPKVEEVKEEPAKEEEKSEEVKEETETKVKKEKEPKTKKEAPKEKKPKKQQSKSK